MKSFRLIAVAVMPTSAFSGGSGRFNPAPGWKRLTMITPSVSETADAATNHSSVRMPIRPTRSAEPMCAMPETSVENTSGAMIILISRRNKAVTMPR